MKPEGVCADGPVGVNTAHDVSGWGVADDDGVDPGFGAVEADEAGLGGVGPGAGADRNSVGRDSFM